MNIPTYRLALLGAFASFLALTGCGSKVKNEAAAPLAPPVDPATAASITGRVTFDGTPPVLHPIDMSANPACMKANPKPVIPTTVMGANGGLADVVVYVKSGLRHYRYVAPQTPANPRSKELHVRAPRSRADGQPAVRGHER